MRLAKILVPLDGSTLAENAIGHAAGLARDSGATLWLVRAAEAHTFPGMDPTDAQVTVIREAETYLAGVKDRLTREGLPEVETSVWYGTAAESIVEAARIGKPDLIVMTTHGRSGLGRLILGSVAESVLRGTRVAIMLVRDAAAPLQVPPSAPAGASKEVSRV